MGGKANLALWQAEPGILAHPTIEPWVWCGKLWPDPVIQPSQYHQLCAVDARLQCALNDDARVHPPIFAHFTALQHGVKEIAVIVHGQNTGNRGLCPKFVNSCLGCDTGLLKPKFA